VYLENSILGIDFSFDLLIKILVYCFRYLTVFTIFSI
jgi:hypothetical protein